MQQDIKFWIQVVGGDLEFRQPCQSHCRQQSDHLTSSQHRALNKTSVLQHWQLPGGGQENLQQAEIILSRKDLGAQMVITENTGHLM